MSLLIPRVVHQVWLGPSPLPDEFAAYGETWTQQNPNWTLELWTEDRLPEGLRHREVYDRLRVPAERADILRLEVLFLYGGVYVDTDFECIRPIEPLLDDVDFFTAYLKPGRVNNAIIGATPGHPIIGRALEELRPRREYGYDKSAAGPLFLDRLLHEIGGGITIFEPELFYPSTPAERKTAVAVHHAARSWKDSAGFRRALVTAEERLWRARAERGYLTGAVERATRREHADGRIERLAVGVTQSVAHVGWFVRMMARIRLRKVKRRSRRALEAATVRVRRPALRLRGSSSAELRIPTVVHHVWLEPGPPPPAVEQARRSWRRTGWEQRMWSNADIPVDVARPEINDRLRSPAERATLLGLELLRRFGGVVVAPGLTCLRPLDPVLAGLDAAATPTGELIAATPGHPSVTRALDSLPATTFWGERPAAVAEFFEHLSSSAIADPGARVGDAVAMRLEPAVDDDVRQLTLAREAELDAVREEVEALRARLRGPETPQAAGTPQPPRPA